MRRLLRALAAWFAPSPAPPGGTVARQAAARPAPRWDDPSWDVLEGLLARRGPDAADPPEQPDRRWLAADLGRLHPRFHPAYYEARVAAILPRIQHALATHDLPHAADCLAGPGRDELQRALVAGRPDVVAGHPPAALMPIIVRDRQADDRDTLWLDLAGHDAVWHLAWQPQGWVLAGIKRGADRAAALAERNVFEPAGPEGGAVERQDGR